MKKYQYQIIRYVHDRITSEFVNIGIVVFNPDIDDRFLGAKFISRFSRISQFFADANGSYLISTLKQFNKEIDYIAKGKNELFFNYKNISEITNHILPKDDSAIECSEILYGVDVNFQVALEDLFERLVNRYIVDSQKPSLDDKHVWNKVYKEYFDKYNVTQSLKAHSIKTPHDVLEFDKTWKNGTTHCYQTLSFDLKKIDSIKNKVYKWNGIISELENGEEEMMLYILTVNPKRNHSIKKFIEKTLTDRQADSKVKVSIVNESEAERFAKKVGKEMEQHSVT